MAFTTLPNAIFGTDKPIGGATGIALRDNPIEIAAGGSGAPKVAVKMSGGSGFLGTPLIVSTLGPFGGVIVDLFATTGGGSSVIVEFSNDGTTYYGSTTLVAASTSSEDVKLYVDFATATYSLAKASNNSFATGAVSGLSLSVTHMRISVPGGSATFAAMVELNGGNSAS